jgi:hypothetical protein
MATAYPLTPADRRDIAALRTLRAAVLQKQETSGVDLPRSAEDRALFDLGFLQALGWLATRFANQLLTESPAAQFEMVEEQLASLSETYREEITEFRRIWFRTYCRWFKRYGLKENHPALTYLGDQVLMKAWLGNIPQAADEN